MISLASLTYLQAVLRSETYSIPASMAVMHADALREVEEAAALAALAEEEPHRLSPVEDAGP